MRLKRVLIARCDEDKLSFVCAETGDRVDTVPVKRQGIFRLRKPIDLANTNEEEMNRRARMHIPPNGASYYFALVEGDNGRFVGAFQYYKGYERIMGKNLHEKRMVG